MEPINYIAHNLKVLRNRKNKTQEDLAFALSQAIGLDMKRSTYSGYENEVSTVPIHVLIHISEYYGISLDDLVKKDLRTMTEFQLRQILTK